MENPDCSCKANTDPNRPAQAPPPQHSVLRLEPADAGRGECYRAVHAATHGQSLIMIGPDRNLGLLRSHLAVTKGRRAERSLRIDRHRRRRHAGQRRDRQPDAAARASAQGAVITALQPQPPLWRTATAAVTLTHVFALKPDEFAQCFAEMDIEVCNRAPCTPNTCPRATPRSGWWSTPSPWSNPLLEQPCGATPTLEPLCNPRWG